MVGSAYTAYLFFTPLTQPTLLDGSLLGPNPINTLSGDGDPDPLGSFTIDLALGSYRMTVDGVNVLITIPEGTGTVSLEDVIDEAALTPGSGSSQGFVQVTNVTALTALPWSTIYKRAWLTTPDAREPREMYWDAASTATHDGQTIVKPYNITALEPGRWLVW